MLQITVSLLLFSNLNRGGKAGLSVIGPAFVLGIELLNLATCRNKVAKRTKHVAPNNVALCCVGMLRSFGRGFM